MGVILIQSFVLEMCSSLDNDNYKEAFGFYYDFLYSLELHYQLDVIDKEVYLNMFSDVTTYLLNNLKARFN